MHASSHLAEFLISRKLKVRNQSYSMTVKLRRFFLLSALFNTGLLVFKKVDNVSSQLLMVFDKICRFVMHIA